MIVNAKCFGCHQPYNMNRDNQKYCTPVCLRKTINQKYYQRANPPRGESPSYNYNRGDSNNPVLPEASRGLTKCEHNWILNPIVGDKICLQCGDVL